MSGKWDDWIVAALLGTARREVPDVTPGPWGLLDAAAGEVLRRRAGLTPAAGAPLPGPAPEDPRPPTPREAAHRLATLLADRPRTAGAARRAAAPDLTELLPQWLTAANAHGYAPPPELLPDLLDAARSRTDLRPAVLGYAGPRARWLAGLNPRWRFVLRAAPGPGSSLPSVDDPQAVARVWREGLFAERAALLDTVRGHDPAAARALLRSTWDAERAEDRLMFLDAFRAGLGPADEPFLEVALADRSRNVRATAADLLAALPGSALAARMAQRAAACVAPSPTPASASAGGPAGIVVTAPRTCDPDMERDGVLARPPAGRGERSWWLGQLVEAAPLATWPGRLGVPDARAVLALPAAEGWRDDLHAAWCRAAVRQGDADWARVLLGAPAAPGAGGPGAVSLAERAKLLAVLGDGERADWVAGFIATHGLSEAFQLLGGCAVPWSRPLGRAVVDALNIARDAGSYPWSFSGVMGLAERCLDPAEGERLTGLTATPDESEDAAPGAGGYWAESFQRLLGTLELRAVMLAELSPDAP
ncbi:DUF5691 domain-containing protein [Streptomyces sp. NPDC058171]